jgi:hypothetical protein
MLADDVRLIRAKICPQDSRRSVHPFPYWRPAASAVCDSGRDNRLSFEAEPWEPLRLGGNHGNAHKDRVPWQQPYVLWPTRIVPGWPIRHQYDDPLLVWNSSSLRAPCLSNHYAQRLGQSRIGAGHFALADRLGFTAADGLFRGHADGILMDRPKLPGKRPNPSSPDG